MNAWPADADAIEAAWQFVQACRGRVVVAAHNDVDGLASVVIMRRALAARGIAAEAMLARRGEHVHQDGMRARILRRQPDALIVLDMGTRPGPIVAGVPTLVVDHHAPSAGLPDGVLLVNGHDREPVAPTSVLTFVVCRHAPDIEGSAWLAALGAVGDLGSAAPFASLLGIEPRGASWSKAAALLNAARRAPEDDAPTALRVLEGARNPQDIAAGRVPGVERLEEYRRVVQAEVERCGRVAPQVMGDAAVIRFSSPVQVHPLIAARWSRRLAPSVVIAANDGFLPGRVNFAARNSSSVDLLQWLRELPFTPSRDAEYANGHPRASGGSLPTEEFETLLAILRARAATTRAQAAGPRRRRRPVARS